MICTCNHCGKPFQTYPSRRVNGSGRYCSVKCKKAITQAKVQSPLTHTRLLECLFYNPKTGVFIWLIAAPGRTAIGDEAGWIEKRKGHRYIEIDGKQFMAHRLAWFYMTGGWPTKLIDHKNRQPSDNTFSNLREATNGQNKANSMTKKSKTGFKGVMRHPNGKLYISQAKFNKVQYYLGCFDTPEEAHRAYVRFAKEKHGEFFHDGH